MMKPNTLLLITGLLLASVLLAVGQQYQRPTVTGRNKVTAMPPPEPLPPYCIPTLPPVNLTTEFGTLIPINNPILNFVGTAQMRAAGGLWLAYTTVWSAAVKFNNKGKPTLPIPNFRRAPPADWTIYNRNVAMTYATYVVAVFLSGPLGAFVKGQMATVGLATDIICTPAEESTKPACYGQLVGRVAIESAKKSGWNLDGSQGWKYNGAVLADYKAEEYTPLNTVDRLTHPQNWQPLLETDGVGGFLAQRSITRFLPYIKPLYLTRRQQRKFTSVPWQPPSDAEYKKAVDDMLAASADLTDENKMKAEIANFQTWVQEATTQIALEKQWDQMTFLRFGAFAIALHDAPIVFMEVKYKYDTVRPQSAIRYVYGDKEVTAWGGPYKGTVSIAANEWIPYCRTAPEPEFMSGQICSCQTFADWVSSFLKTDKFSVTYKVKKGCSRIEPYATPAKDLEITINSATELVRLCQDGRVYGGMHFVKTAEETPKACKGMGSLAYKYMSRKFWT